MNSAFRLRSSGPVHLQSNVSTALAEQTGDLKMFANVSKLSAPIAGAILLVSAGFITTASAAPLVGKTQIEPAKSELVVKVDHRRGNGRGGNWNGRHGGRHYEMGPRQIRRSLRHRGFDHIKILDRRGPMYIVRAKGWRGMPVRLVVDSRNANIVRSHPIGNRGHWQRRWY
ncbi:hypothetical protein Q669_16590 [Labrenzia sp. C1B10]|nr:hypothetical protein Q669_16590 [Labrenzia sp. C1B10]ERS06056.1 hypothetical protein Q675_27860 [Labrenzia sp. C1B70]